MIYEDKKKNDQIAISTGQNGFSNSKRLLAFVFTPIFTETLYPASAICNSGSQAILKNRLPWHHSDAERFFRFTQGFGFEASTPLFYSLLRRKKAYKKRAFEKLLAAIFEHDWVIRELQKTSEAAIDSTGLEAHHISYHFVNCTKRPPYFRRTWPKITVVCDTQTHLIASCIVTRGPSYDFGLFEEAIRDAHKQVRFKRILADGGYDSEANHRLAREIFGMETMIKLNLRGSKKPPKGKHRRRTKDSFDKKIFNNRWQIESVFSRNKRLLGSSLRNRTEISRQRECLLRVLTHNLMIIRRAA